MFPLFLWCFFLVPVAVACTGQDIFFIGWPVLLGGLTVVALRGPGNPRA